MDLEKTLDSQKTEDTASSPSSSLASSSGHAPAPAPRPPVHSGGDDIADSLTISDRGKANVAGLLLWLSAVVAIGMTVFFWFLNQSVAQDLADKTIEKDQVVAEISSPTYAALESRANQFQAAVNKLSTATKDRFSMEKFLPLLYAKINKNVVISDLSVDDSGKISFSATTDSYKSAAQQIETLKSWEIGGNKVATTVTLDSESESVDTAVVVSFSVSATIDKNVVFASDLTNSTEGGN